MPFLFLSLKKKKNQSHFFKLPSLFFLEPANIRRTIAQTKKKLLSRRRDCPKIQLRPVTYGVFNCPGVLCREKTDRGEHSLYRERTISISPERKGPLSVKFHMYETKSGTDAVVAAMCILFATKVWYDIVNFAYHRERMMVCRELVTEGMNLLRISMEKCGLEEIGAAVPNSLFKDAMSREKSLSGSHERRSNCRRVE